MVLEKIKGFLEEDEEEKEIRRLLQTIPRDDLMKFLVRNYGWSDEGDRKEDIINGFLFEGVSLASVKRFVKKYKKDFKTKTIRPNQTNVKHVITKEWNPPKKPIKEEGFKKDLYLFLVKRFGREYVRKEKGEYRADIVINNRIPIELKYNFGRHGLDRLQRQIANYKKDKNYLKNKILIVFCGIREYDDGFGMFEKRYKRDKRLLIIKKIESQL